MEKQKKEDVSNLVKRVHEVETELRTHIRGRDKLIHKLSLTLMAGENMMILGRHGEAKGLIVDMLCKATNLEVYKKQLHNETQLKEIIGILNPISYKEGRLELLKTQFWKSNILFFDEFLRGRSEFLDFLLEVMNERMTSKGYNGEVALPIVSVICVTNPTTEEYNTERPDLALLDRFIMIDNIDHLIKENRESFEQAIDDDCLLLEDFSIKKTDLNYTDFKKLRDSVKNVKVNTHIIMGVVSKLSDMGFNFSTRFSKKAKLLVKAEALYNGRTTAEHTDYMALSYALINRFDDLTDEKINKAIDEGIVSIEYSDNLNKIRNVMRVQEALPRIEKAIEIIQNSKEQYNEYPDSLKKSVIDLGKLLKRDLREHLQDVPPKMIDLLDTENFNTIIKEYVDLHKVDTSYLSLKEQKIFDKEIKPLIKVCKAEDSKVQDEVKYVISPVVGKLEESVRELKTVEEALQDHNMKSAY